MWQQLTNNSKATTLAILIFAYLNIKHLACYLEHILQHLVIHFVVQLQGKL